MNKKEKPFSLSGSSALLMIRGNTACLLTSGGLLSKLVERLQQNRAVCKNCQKSSHSSSTPNHQKCGRASIMRRTVEESTSYGTSSFFVKNTPIGKKTERLRDTDRFLEALYGLRSEKLIIAASPEISFAHGSR